MDTCIMRLKSTQQISSSMAVYKSFSSLLLVCSSVSDVRLLLQELNCSKHTWLWLKLAWNQALMHREKQRLFLFIYIFWCFLITFWLDTLIEIANNAKQKSTDYEFQHVTDENNNNSTSNLQPSGTPVSIEVKSGAVTPFTNIETLSRKFYFFRASYLASFHSTILTERTQLARRLLAGLWIRQFRACFRPPCPSTRRGATDSCSRHPYRTLYRSRTKLRTSTST